MTLAAVRPATIRLMAFVPRLFQRLLESLTALADDYGDLVELPAGNRLFYLVNDPDLIQDILVTRAGQFEKFPRIDASQGLFGDGLLTSEEPEHLRHRRIAQPAFHRERMAGYADIMAACAGRAADCLRPGSVVDMAPVLQRLALDIVSRALLGVDTSAEAEAIERAMAVILPVLNRLVTPLGPLLMGLPSPWRRRYFDAIATMDGVVARVIARRRSGPPGDDLIHLLLPEMDARQLRDEVVTLLVAGHDTTANALAWTLHMVSQHPLIEDRMCEEIDGVLAGRLLPGAADYVRLEYTERVLSEAMRLYPPVWILGRRALAPYSYGDRLHAGAGAVFLVSMYVLHRRERWYPHPLVFDPDRWVVEARAMRPRYAYLPFGAGPRLCIGERFAWMESVLSLAVLYRRFRFRPVEGAVVEPLAQLTLRPKFGLPMRVVEAHLP